MFTCLYLTRYNTKTKFEAIIYLFGCLVKCIADQSAYKFDRKKRITLRVKNIESAINAASAQALFMYN